MTVKEAIKMLSDIDDKEMMLMIDCPYCGKGNQLEAIAEAVILSGPKEKE